MRPRRRPREIFGPLAKWPHLERHYQTHTHQQLDRIVDLLTEIRDHLAGDPADVTT